MQNARITLLTIIALVLFLGGILLLLSPVKFWSLFLGIPSTQAGIVFLIMAFEKLDKESPDEEIEEEVIRQKRKKILHESL